MNHAAHARPAVASLYPLKKLCAVLALACTATGAQAVVNTKVDFEGIDSGFVGDSDYFSQAGVYLSAYSNVIDAHPGDLVGAVIDHDALLDGMCGNLACPTNNSTTFYAALNDGVLQLDPVVQNGTIHVYSLDASFIGATAGASYPAVSGLLRVQGFFANGGSQSITMNLAGPSGGSFKFAHYDTGATFSSYAFTSVAFFGFTCNTGGSCQAFQSDKGQFALDNINLGVTAVPEPDSYAMMLLGLAGLGAVARRRQRGNVSKLSKLSNA